MRDRVDKLRGIVTLIVEVLATIKPTDPLGLFKHPAHRKQNWSDSSVNSPVKGKKN